jgi:hypothetical protein
MAEASRGLASLRVDGEINTICGSSVLRSDLVCIDLDLIISSVFAKEISSHDEAQKRTLHLLDADFVRSIYDPLPCISALTTGYSRSSKKV